MNAIATLRAGFSPLRYPNFRLYIFGQAVSMVGTWLQATALGWIVWQLTGSEATLGIVNVLNTIPLLLLTPYAGVWADRWDRRKLLIGTQVAAMLIAFMVAFLTQTGLIQIWHIYIMAAALGIVSALDLPAQQAFLGDLAGVAEIRKAVNVNGMVVQGSRVIGPAMAGFLIARIGIAPAFWLNGLSFLIVIGSLYIVRAAQVQARPAAGSPFQQIRESLAFVRTQPRILEMFAFVFMMFMFSWSIINNLLPAVADKVLGGDAETLGLLVASSGAGALFSLLFVVPLVQARRHPGWMLALSMLWAGSWLFVFGLSNNLYLSMLALFMSFLGNPVVYTITIGLSQLMSPPNMRARIISLFTLCSFGVQPFGGFITGYIAEHFGVQTAILLNSVLLLATASLILITRRGLREWEVKAKPSEAVEVGH